MSELLYYLVFNNGFGYSDVSLHLSKESADQKLSEILFRPENFNILPNDLREIISSEPDKTFWGIQDLIGEGVLKWIVEIGATRLPENTKEPVVAKESDQ